MPLFHRRDCAPRPARCDPGWRPWQPHLPLPRRIYSATGRAPRLPTRSEKLLLQPDRMRVSSNSSRQDPREIYFFDVSAFITTPVACQLPFCLMTTRNTLYSPSMLLPLLSWPLIVV